MAQTGSLVYTFRSHHNAHTEQDGSGAQIVRVPTQTGLVFAIIQGLSVAVTIHYFLWFIPMLAVLYLPTHYGYWPMSICLLAMYLRSYFKADELDRGRTWEWFRTHGIWKYMQSYAQLECVREAQLDPKRKYIFATHPHGILILSRMSTFGGLFETLFPGVEQRCLSASPMFSVPGTREVCLWMGAVRADKSNAVRLLNKHNLNLLIYPGGSSEIFETNPYSKETVLVARKGFIKLALQHGCDIVPSFVFGEKHAYHKLNLPDVIKSFFMNALRTPLVIFWGKYYTWMPLQNSKVFLSVVYGAPLRVAAPIAEPTDEQINTLYETYYGVIKDIFGRYKTRYGYDEAETLVIRQAKQEPSEKSTMLLNNNNNNNNNNVDEAIAKKLL